MARRWNPWIVGFYLCLVLVHVVVTTQRARQWEFPNPVDEIQHLSFVFHFRETGELFPDYGRIRVLEVVQPVTWSADLNYLNHPIVYHALMSAFIDDGDTLGSAALRLRLVNAGLSAVGLAAVFVFGLGAFAALRQHLLFGLTVAFCPMIAGLGGQINNDNLAFLGGALVLIGLGRLFRGGPDTAAALLVGAGFALGAFSKLSAAVMLALWICFALVASARRGGPPWRPGPFLMMAVLGGLGGLPYLANLVTFGSVLYDNSAFFRVAGEFDVLPLGDFALWFLHALAATWTTNQPADAVQLAALAVLVVIAGFGLATAGRRDAAAPVGRCCAVAVLATLPIHLGYDYAAHAAAGHLAGADFRLYLPLWGGLAAGVALAVTALRREASQAALVLTVAVLLFYSAVVGPMLQGTAP